MFVFVENVQKGLEGCIITSYNSVCGCYRCLMSDKLLPESIPLLLISIQMFTLPVSTNHSN